MRDQGSKGSRVDVKKIRKALFTRPLDSTNPWPL